MVDFICPQCIGEKTLSNRLVKMRPGFDDNKCDFHPRRKGIPIVVVAEIVDQVFRNNFGFGELKPHIWDDSDRIDYIQQGECIEEILGELLLADDPVVEGLKEQLFELDDYWPPDGGEPFYEDDQCYQPISHDGRTLSTKWSEFRISIKHDQRFFNDAAVEFLTEIFKGIHQLSDINLDRAVYMAGPNQPISRIFRVRRADGTDIQERIRKEPWKELGPPPESNRSAGRMNPSGIAAFYGALELNTCIAEMRPPVGSTLIGAAFDIIRPICVLDLTKFRGPPKTLSPFNPQHMRTMGQWAFMQSFRHVISLPILPDDEHLEYVPTQAVAEFLNRHHKVNIKGEETNIDAIVYPSAQTPDGTNIVLLAKASEVKNPNQETKITKSRQDEIDWPILHSMLPTPSSPSLTFIENEIQTIIIRGAHYDTHQYTPPSDPDLYPL